jgi:4-hydroxybenzoate polyprenyltransferase
LLAAASALALVLPKSFVAVLGGYLVFSIAYSVVLKRKLVLDVVVLAGLYGTRIVAGSSACSIVPSEWLLAFSFFFFFSLALVKRTSELVSFPVSKKDEIGGRGYRRSDATAVMILSGSSALVSVLVFALYANSEHVRTLYTRPELLWGISTILVYWLSRTIILAGRGRLDQDPVVFALTDRGSLVAGAIAVALALAAI